MSQQHQFWLLQPAHLIQQMRRLTMEPEESTDERSRVDPWLKKKTFLLRGRYQEHAKNHQQL